MNSKPFIVSFHFAVVVIAMDIAIDGFSVIVVFEDVLPEAGWVLWCG